MARLLSVGDLVYRADLQTDRYNLTAALPTWLFLTQPTIPQGLARTDDLRDEPRAAVADSEDRRGRPRPAPRDTRPRAGHDLQRSRHAEDRARRRRRTDRSSCRATAPGSSTSAVSARSTIRASSCTRRLLRTNARAAQGRAARRHGARRHRLEPQAPRALGNHECQHGRDRTRDRDAVEDRRQRPAGRRLSREGTDVQTMVRSPGARCHGRATAVTTRCSRRCAARGRSTATSTPAGRPARTPTCSATRSASTSIPRSRPTTCGLVQSLVGRIDRYITRVDLTFDGKDPVTVDLDDASRTPEGQTVVFPARRSIASRSPSTTRTSGRRADDFTEPCRLRRDRRSRQRAGRAGHPGRRDRALADRPGRRRRHERSRPRARVLDEPVPDQRDPAPASPRTRSR